MVEFPKNKTFFYSIISFSFSLTSFSLIIFPLSSHLKSNSRLIILMLMILFTLLGLFSYLLSITYFKKESNNLQTIEKIFFFVNSVVFLLFISYFLILIFPRGGHFK